MKSNIRRRVDFYKQFSQKTKIIDNSVGQGHRIFDDGLDPKEWHGKCRIIRISRQCGFCKAAIDHLEKQHDHCTTCAWKLGLRA